MKFSTTGPEKVTFKNRWLLNRGDHMGRIDYNTNLYIYHFYEEILFHSNTDQQDHTF